MPIGRRAALSHAWQRPCPSAISRGRRCASVKRGEVLSAAGFLVTGAVVAGIFCVGALWLLLRAGSGTWFGDFLDRVDWKRVHVVELLFVGAVVAGVALGGASASAVFGFACFALVLGYPLTALASNAWLRRRLGRGDDE